MNKPLLIYLDSSDISNFSDPSKRTSELLNIEQQLFSWLEQGKIEFRFSHVHVIEAAPTELQYVDLAIKRFLYIKRLCGYKCFASPIRILESEARALSNQEVDMAIINDDGEWYPSLDETDTFIDFQEGYRKEIAVLTDRKQRRIAERKFFDKNGNLNSSAKDNIKKIAPDIAKEISAKYPIGQTSMELAYKYFLKTGSMSLFMDEVKKSLADMNCIGDWYQRQWDLIIPNSSYLRSIGEDLKNSLIPINDSFKDLSESMLKSGYTTSEVNNITYKNFDKMLITMPKGIANTLASNLGLEIAADINWQLAPTLLTLTTLSVSLIKQIAISGQKPRTSDFGDLYHAAFLPHVDIFRADSSIATAISKAKLPFNTDVVGKLVELPERIASLLKQRA